MVFDAARSRIVLFGGSGSAATLNDTWQFDAARTAWSELQPGGTVPAARSRHQSAYVPELSAAFYFGGNLDTGGKTNELWMYGPAAAPIPPRLTREGIVDAFSQRGGTVAPGELVSLFGSALGPAQGAPFQFDGETGLLPGSGGGVQVTFNGIPAPLLYADAGQINAQVPYELAGAQTAQIQVTVNGQRGDAIPYPVSATKPALLPRVFNQDGRENSAGAPARAGEIVVLFATGQGVTSPPSITGAVARGPAYPVPQAETRLLVGGVAAEILFRGQAPGTTGVMQVNARVPTGVAAGPAVPVVLEVGGVASQVGVNVAIR